MCCCCFLLFVAWHADVVWLSLALIVIGFIISYPICLFVVCCSFAIVYCLFLVRIGCEACSTGRDAPSESEGTIATALVITSESS